MLATSPQTWSASWSCSATWGEWGTGWAAGTCTHATSVHRPPCACLPHDSLALKVHREALSAMRAVWLVLMQPSVRFEALSSAVKHMDLSIRAAERVYRTVLQKHSGNVKMVRLYAKVSGCYVPAAQQGLLACTG